MMNFRDMSYEEAVDALRATFGFDFVTIGLASMPGAPLRWLHSAGATGERYKRIVLSPGHGIGGIVLKAGKPMMFTDIDNQLDPREYSSYPIVFAEDLRSFCALPLIRDSHVAGVLLCAYRHADPAHEGVFIRLMASISDGISGMDVNEDEFLRFNEIPHQQESEFSSGTSTDAALAIGYAQEQERKRISRDLHDGVAQELLSVSMMLRQLELLHKDEKTAEIIREANANLDRIFEEIHNLSVQLRPLALDDLGLVAALRAQADLYRKTFGANITLDDTTDGARYARDIETQTYRIAQEALLNACKYSGSDAIAIAIGENDGTLALTVYDQGIGFDTERPTIQGGGCGLAGMRERAKSIGGRLGIHSGEGGTTITLTVPLREG